jgi:replicative DNA helicase
LYCISYKSVSQIDYGNSRFNEIPGNFTGIYRLAFINDARTAVQRKDADDTTINDAAARKLSREINDLKEAAAAADKKLDEILKLEKQLIFDIEKQLIKFNMNDSSITTLKEKLDALQQKIEKETLIAKSPSEARNLLSEFLGRNDIPYPGNTI